MNVGGVETAAVYLSPQAITPLSASKEPIALALAVRPEPSDRVTAAAAKEAENSTKASPVHEHKQNRTPAIPEEATAGASFAGRVDVYV